MLGDFFIFSCQGSRDLLYLISCLIIRKTMFNIPKTMSTQHPDNVEHPPFTANGLIGGEDEIHEAFYAFSDLGCTEQMWDFEGKEADNFVVKKLLTNSDGFFKQKKLGQDVLLTFRVPNPEVEKGEAKILLETLESIPRSFDAAKLFYGENIIPIFEVIQPMTMSADSLNKIYHYYRDFVVGKKDKYLGDTGTTVRDWIGDFGPEKINVIPLFEDMDSLLRADEIVAEYLKDKQVDYQRVFLARSDPAVYYGSLAAVLLNKIALFKLHKLQEKIGVPIYPILGVGSAPFRGNLRPETVEQLIGGYPSVRTFTIQSSFKFDYSAYVVRTAIEKINNKIEGAPLPVVDEEKILVIIEKLRTAYFSHIKKLALIINQVARFVPKRRKRKMHIGLFEYARKAEDVKLPRAIAFTAALYSIGIAPELLGVEVLTDEDLKVIRAIYPNVDYDLRSAFKYCDLESPFMPRATVDFVKNKFSGFEGNGEHRAITSQIANLVSRSSLENMERLVLDAARMRGFLG